MKHLDVGAISTPKMIAAATGIPVRTIYRWVHDGDLFITSPPYPVMVDVAALWDYIDHRTNAAHAGALSTYKTRYEQYTANYTK